MKLWVKKATSQLTLLPKFISVNIVKPIFKLFGRKTIFLKSKKLAERSLKAVRAALFLRAARASHYFHKVSAKEECFFEERSEKPVEKKVFTSLKEFFPRFIKGPSAKEEPKKILETLKNMKAKVALSLTQVFQRNNAPKKGEVFVEERMDEQGEKPKAILQKMKTNISLKMQSILKYFRSKPAKGDVFVEKVEKPLPEEEKQNEDS